MRRLLDLRRIWWFATLSGVLSANRMLAGDNPSDALDVRNELVSPGSKFVGQPFELRISVNAGAERPRLELPTAAGAELAIVNTSLQPVTVSQIGSFTAQENRFLTRIRVIPRRVGPLVIPPLRASLGRRSGRSQPLKLTILTVPSAGRPAEFLGGVGPFSVNAAVSATAIRVGQEFEFRLDVSGSAAAGMTEAPSLEPFRRLAIAPTMQLVSNQMTIEPLARTYLFRLRPTQAGQVVLPPVRIAGFDPTSQRYLTRATIGLPLRVLAVPAFDPATLGDTLAVPNGPRLQQSPIWALAGATAIIIGVAGMLWLKRVRTGRRSKGQVRVGRELALQISSELARVELAGLAGLDGIDRSDDADQSLAMRQWSTRAAQEITDGLIRYLEATVKRPPGALTPDEALVGIATVTGSTTLAAQARELVSVCDGVRFRQESPLLEEHICAFIGQARSLFAQLAEQQFAPVKAGASEERLSSSSLPNGQRRASSSERDAAVLNSSSDLGSTRLARSRSKP